MSCANCGTDLGDKVHHNERGGGGIGYILYSGNKNNCSVGSVLDERSLELVEDAEETVSIRKALNTIFYFDETLPTIPFISERKKEVSACIWDTKEEEPGVLDLCTSCAKTLTLLYNAFNQFIQVCQLEGRIGRELKGLEKLKKVKYKKYDNEEWAKEGSEGVNRSIYKSKEKQVNENERNIEVGGHKDEEEELDVEVKEEVDDEFEEPLEDFFDVNDDDIVDDIDNNTGEEAEVDRIRLSTLNIDSKKVSDNLTRSRKLAKTKKQSNLNEIPAKESTKDSSTNQEMVIKDLKIVITRLEDMADFKQKFSTSRDKDDESDCCILKETNLKHLSSEYEDDGKKSQIQNQNTKTVVSGSIENNGTPPLKQSRFYSSGGSFKCLVCGVGFAIKENLQRHSKVHSVYAIDLAQCQTCFKIFRHHYGLRHHKRKVHGEDVPSRIKEKTSNAERRKIQKKELIAPKRIFSCPACDQKFVSAEEIKTHVEVDHKDLVNPWKCAKCPSEFPTLEELSKHKIQHSDSRKIDHCDICMQSFSDFMHLKRHQLRFHQVRSDLPIPKDSSDEKEESEIEEIFNNDTLEFIRKERKRPKPKPKIGCTVCGKYFHTPKNLRYHLILHGIGDKYKCDECGKEFNRWRSLKDHQKLHIIGANLYKCPEQLCPYHEKGFPRKRYLQRHLKTTHPEMAKTDNSKPERPFVCNVCERRFKVQSKLKLHMIGHTGKKDFLCDSCGKCFSRNDYLKSHVKRVHEGLQMLKKSCRASKTEKSANRNLECLNISLI